MRSRELTRWLERLDSLTPHQRHQVQARLQALAGPAFRWRHRFLSVPGQVKDRQQDGVVEADEAHFPRSYKGQPRSLREATSCPSRHRGGRAAKRGLPDEQVPVLVLRNCSEHTADYRPVLGQQSRAGGSPTAKP